MEAIVLAGGFGTRLRKVVPDLPKPMAPIGGRPFLEILLTSLANKGFNHVVLSVGYMATTIADHFGDGFAGLELVYVTEEEPLGTGGAVRAALDHCVSDHAFILNGDTFLDFEADRIEALWQSHRNPIIVGCQVHDTDRYGRLIIEQGRVVGFMEKGTSGPGVINAGCYVFGRHLLDQFSAGSVFSLEKDFLERSTKALELECFLTSGQFIDIGVPEDYELAQNILR